MPTAGDSIAAAETLCLILKHMHTAGDRQVFSDYYTVFSSLQAKSNREIVTFSFLNLPTNSVSFMFIILLRNKF
jgi:hypothetical protein